MNRFSKSVLTGTLLAVTFGIAGAQANEVVLRYAGTLPVTHHLTAGQEMFAELVAEKSGGEIEIEVYPAGQLYTAHDIPSAVVTGAVDIGYNLTNVWTEDAISDINDVPFLFRDADHAREAWDPDGELFALYSQTLENRMMKPLGLMFFGSLFDIANNSHPMVEQGDFDGVAIRTYGALASEAIRLLGGSPVTMDPGEMYLALQNDTIDAVITGLTSIDQRKLWEAADYATIAQAAFGVFAVNMNLNTFNGLSQEHQNALMEAGREVFEWSVDEAKRQDEASLEFLEERIDVSVLNEADREAWAEMLEPVVEGWMERASEDERAVIEWIRGL